MSRTRLEALFVDSSAGRIFLLLRAPERATRCVLFVPPFGEEMNKSRRQVTETANALIAEGFAVLVVDLYGTGDSEGEFGDATWEYWKSDISAATKWIAESNLSLHSVVATRLGCILAAESLRESGDKLEKAVFWQPVGKGQQFMTQFLRLRVAASMMGSGGQETIDDLKQRLLEGETLSVAGYALSPGLWESVQAAELSACLASCLGTIAIFEVGRALDGDLSAAGKALAATAGEQGLEVTGERVPGEPFWTATEIVTNTELTHRTARYLADSR